MTCCCPAPGLGTWVVFSKSWHRGTLLGARPITPQAREAPGPRALWQEWHLAWAGGQDPVGRALASVGACPTGPYSLVLRRNQRGSQARPGLLTARPGREPEAWVSTR